MGRRGFALLPLRPHGFGFRAADFLATREACSVSSARPSGQSWVFVHGIRSFAHLIGQLQRKHQPMFGSVEVIHASIISIRFGGNSIGTQSSSTCALLPFLRSAHYALPIYPPSSAGKMRSGYGSPDLETYLGCGGKPVASAKLADSIGRGWIHAAPDEQTRLSGMRTS